MKYFASLCAIVLAGSMPGFAVSANHTSVNPENQFHFKPSPRRAAQAAAHNVSLNHAHPLDTQHGPVSRTMASKAQSHPASAKNVRRLTSNPPIGKTGFLSATQIPAGPTPGALAYWPALSGDFNGDGKTDIVSEVETNNGSSWVFSISVVLSNGDGTFQSAVLNSITDSCPALIVADVNGDHKSDLIIGHAPNQCGNTNTNPTFDVWLSNGDGTFTPSSNTNNTIPVTGLAGGTIADVNNDGKLDLVVVDDNSPANVWTFLGNGDGTFLAPTSVALSGQVGYNMVIADLNGDGLLDIADLDYNTNELTVYVANTTPGYNAGVPYPTSGTSPVFDGCTLTAGDLNGDGIPELVSANCYDNNITVYVNNKDGSFQNGVYYNAAVNAASGAAADFVPDSVTIADVNGDGKNDIISSNYYGGDVTVLLGNGDGTVNVPSFGYSTGGYVVTPAIVADFNGDGFADIVVSDDEFSFVYMKGYGDGTFHAARDYYSSLSTNWGYSINVATGDFNGDGYPDVVASNCCDSTMGISVFLSNPDGSLQSPVNYGTDGSMYQVQVADINGDQKLDIVATDLNGWVQVFTGNGDGTFTVGSTYQTDVAANAPVGLVIGDFNKDGYPDLAVLNTNGQDVAILLNDKTGAFPTYVPYTLSASLNQWQGNEMAVGDLGNGSLDLVIPLFNSTSGNVAILMGNGDGTFNPTEVDVPMPSGYPVGVTLADLNKDGKLDLAATTYFSTGADVVVAIGNGDGTFQTPMTTLVSTVQNESYYTPYTTFLSSTDIDGDGNPDLVYTNSGYGTVGILFGQGNGSFYDPVEYPVGLYAWGIAVADVNNDGKPDVITASDDFAGVTVLLNNNGTGTLGSYTIGTSAQGATLTAGQSATFTLTITPNNHYNGTVTLSCPSNLPALMTCSLSSSSVTLDGLNPQTVTLTITTTGPTSSLRHAAGVNQKSIPRPRSSAMLLLSLNGMGVFGMFVAGGFSKKCNRWSVLAVLVLAMSFFLVGCGGSSSGNNNNNNPPPTKSNTTSAVTSSAATTLVGQAVTFTGTVSANSGTPTGTVTFLDGTTTLGTGTLSGGKATFQTSSLAAGVHSIAIAYGGASSFAASTSTAYSQTVDNPGTATGTYTVTVTGTGTAGTNGVGSPNQSIGLTLIVQ